MLFRGFSSDLCYNWDSRFQGRETRSRTGGREIAIMPEWTRSGTLFALSPNTKGFRKKKQYG